MTAARWRRAGYANRCSRAKGQHRDAPGDGSTQRSDGPYDGPAIIQRAHPLTRFEGGYPLIGSWVIGDHACGIGIREDDSAITRDSARFVPHAIVDEAPTRIYV